VIDLILFIIPSWLLMGPPLPIFLAIVFFALGLLSALNHGFRYKTVFLTAMMSIMLVQCIVFVFVVHFELWKLLVSNQTVHEPWFAPLLFILDLRLAEFGALAAICVGFYLEFVRARLDLSRTFPNLCFLKAPGDLQQVVRRLAKVTKIECPEVSLLDSGVPSAFTIRTRGKYTISVSVGLLESLDAAEVRACLVHEFAHIKNHDFLIRSIVTVAKVALFAKPLSYFIEAAIYRTREFLADKTAVDLIGEAAPLISALTKLQQVDACESAVGSLTCCLHGKKNTFWLLNKHPNLTKRIRLLTEMKTSANR